MSLDKLTRLEIAEAVGKAVREALEVYKEEWVTDVGLCEDMPMFSMGWLRAHGDKLPRERLELTDEVTGRKSRGIRWMYPLHKIRRMVATRELNQVINN